jgi:alpha-L-rhamnosidase
MKRSILALLILQSFIMTTVGQVTVSGLLTENLSEPISIDTGKPRFTWKLGSDGRDVLQTAYEIKVTDGKKTLWDSGKKVSDQSVQVVYAGTPLESCHRYKWQVRIWDNNGKVTAWSKPASFRMGMLRISDWKAKWIVPGYAEDTVMRPSPLMRKQFSITKKIESACAYITAHGMYEAEINGKRVGDAYLTPGWTSYNKRLQYQVYDITAMLHDGANAIGVMLGSGWYRGTIGFHGNNVYGKDIALLCQINIVYTDGSIETVITDNTWRSSTGPVRYSEIYDGEIYDARLEKKDWTMPGYDDSSWTGASEASFPVDVLIATQNEPVRQHETFVPVRIFRTPKGEQVIDFGQNLVGYVKMKVSGKAGDEVTLSHAEVLDKKGNFYTDNLRSAKAQDKYTLKGGGEESYVPHFTWHGFRYLKVEGYPGEIKKENFTAIAIYSDMRPTGTFITSDSLINKLQHNIQWGQKGNFLDVPTDCPQRDERLGWTGDAQVFSRTAAFNMNVDNFFTKWLKDITADQVEGRVPYVIPSVVAKNEANSAGWADVATIIPWNIYLAFGDIRVLEQQYPSMKAYIESIRKVAVNDLWNSGFHFGDWLFFSLNDDTDGSSAVTDKYLIAQCFYANSVQMLINAATVLGKSDDVALYTELLKRIKDAFMKEYVTPNGRLVSGTQTAYVLALNFDMLPESMRTQAASRLADNVENYGHLTTGFLGTPYLCHVLTRFGYNDLAYDLLMRKQYPSWLYPVTMGATTIWERWDGERPDSTFQTPGMNSFNHYAYGAIGDWMYRVVVGIDTYTDQPGYKRSIIKPHPGGSLTEASASIKTYYGTLSGSWKISGKQFFLDVKIPANTSSTIYVPSKSAGAISEGGKPLSQVKEISIKGIEGGYIILNIGSGEYHFEAD